MIAMRPTHIRPSAAADLAGMHACLAAAFAAYRASYTAGMYADTVPGIDGLRERLRTMTGLVACTDDGAVVGTIAYEATGDDGHLRGMAVQPAFQGTDVAARLLDAAERALAARGCRRVTLDTTAPLQRAIRFYERRGYRPTGQRHEQAGMVLFEYARDLDPPPALQLAPGVLRWRVVLPAPRHEVFELLATDRGRERFWAERSTTGADAVVHLTFPGGATGTLELLEQVPDERLETRYFGTPTSFALEALAATRTVVTVTARDVPPDDVVDLAAGWVSVLLNLKAVVQAGTDLRNHDPAFTWSAGFVDH
jgi:GNAT superfamily N-acetyltransferase/uncharacterized protein YndB with AHSA1/START domain